MNNYPDGMRMSELDGDAGCPECGGDGTDSDGIDCEFCDGDGSVSSEDRRTYWAERADPEPDDYYYEVD